MDIAKLFYVDGMIFVGLAMPTLLVMMFLLDRRRAAAKAPAGRRAYGRPGPLTSANARS